MRTTVLGTGGPGIGVVGLGCMGMSFSYDMGAPHDDARSIGVIRQALDLGATLIDTADVYGPYTNEQLVGRALRGGYRDRAVLATKVGLVSRPDDLPRAGGNAPGMRIDGRPEHIRRSIDGSLQRLGVDHVDLYQLHRVDPVVPLEETWGAMAELVRAGKARAIGLSEVPVDLLRRAQAIHRVASVQSELSLWTRDPLDDVLPICLREGVSFIAFSPLGRGFLSGRFTSVDDLPEQDSRRRLPRFQQEALAANLAIVQRVRDVAARHGATPAQVAIAWVLAQGAVPIPGTKTPEYLADNIGAAALDLTDSDLADLGSLPAPEGGRF